ncbi:MAG: hypothetical protein KGI71_05890 [Patescibacteria group bacterium]|nr:hypothetical protein [Patescibacteria group bacterium]
MTKALKYLFEAVHSDGRVVKQTVDDVSRVDPSKSSFFDINHDTLTRFEMVGADQSFEVDLVSKSIRCNGTTIRRYPQDDSTARLVYFRRRQHHFDGSLNKVGDDTTYFLGFEDGSGKLEMEIT